MNCKALLTLSTSILVERGPSTQAPPAGPRRCRRCCCQRLGDVDAVCLEQRTPLGALGACGGHHDSTAFATDASSSTPTPLRTMPSIM